MIGEEIKKLCGNPHVEITVGMSELVLNLAVSLRMPPVISA